MSVSTSARLDAHSEYGTFVNPRLSLLLRRPESGLLARWTTRLSAGTGAFAPTPFTEETEATGLTPVTPPSGGLPGLVAERAFSASLDVGGPFESALGRVELNATAFGSRVAHPLQVREAQGTTSSGAPRITLGNAPAPTRTWGGELLARFVRELGGAEERLERGAAEGAGAHADDHEGEPPSFRITGSYTFLRSTECDSDAPPSPGTACLRRDVPLTPRHASGVVVSIEQPERLRVGLEVYYTGRQALDQNPYRAESRPYVVLGLLGERAFATRAGVARVFLNLENLTNVRQGRYDPLLLPARGDGGRWTTDAWTDLAGFTANGGVRFEF
jgi:iron complex outermembrane receptor protein